VSPDLGPAVQVALPTGDYDLYEAGVMVELQFRDWVNAPWGYLLAIGYGEWRADEDAEDPGPNLYDYDGELEVVPFGGSLILKAYEGQDIAITLEAGVRYFITDSSITARDTAQSPDNEYTVSVDDSLVFRAGASLDYVISPDYILSLGGSYLTDIDEGSVSTELSSATDNSFESLVFEVALRMPL
jgi:hypothetical protein